MDALDAAIDYKNESISNKRDELRRSVILSQSEDHFSSKLRYGASSTVFYQLFKNYTPHFRTF